MRAVPEWIGATADTPIPKRVRLRIWLREDGRCYLSGKKIDALKDSFQFEHVKPVGLGLPGQPHFNRESNIRLALTDAHKEKTKADTQQIRKADRQRLKFLGLWPQPKRKIQSRGFDRRWTP